MIFSDKNRPKTVIFGNIKLQFTKIAENQLYKQLNEIYKNSYFDVKF